MRLVDQAPSSADVVIIGGGIVGAATAFFLTRSGRQPIIIERADRLASATTSVSAHAIRCQFTEPENIAQMTESLRIYECFADLLGNDAVNIGLTQNGYLFASTDVADEPLFARRVSRQQELGIADVELLDGDEIRRRFPWMSQDIRIGAFRQKDGWLDSVRATEAFATAAGVLVALATTVERIVVDGDLVTGVVTDRGTISTENLVLAAGPDSRAICPEPLPVAHWRRHRIVTEPDPRIPRNAPMTIDANTGAHWRPHLGGALMAWAQPETDRVATWPVETDPSWPDLVLRSDRGISRLSPFWEEIASELTPDRYLFTAGLYTVTPDQKPLIGPANQTRGLFLNTGYSGHGIMGSPSGSRLLADVLAGKVATGDNPFHPGRFDNGVKPPDVEKIVL
jgi:sarcosine oxidase subunit beta